MDDITIKVENLSKKYTIGAKSSGSLRETLVYIWNSFINKTKNKEHDFLALNDISFEVKQGEVLGIIGKNGAGKSTLLKVLSRITEPTSGRFIMNGRISSLLEVGTGFHPELTGRENIFLNGTILGMTKKEIKQKFDEIVDFSGVEKFIDTPVKHYSSGMYVRLAFAVAAHLEPEILIIDEVLAVGDSEFQKKCLGKMNEVAKKGRTVLFVSHNMTALAALCTRGIWIKNGQVAYDGDIHTAIKKYLDKEQTNNQSNDLSISKNREGNGLIKFIKYKILNEQEEEIDYVFSGQNITFILDFKINTENPIPPLHFSLWFLDQNENPYFHLSNSVANGEEFIIKNGPDKGTVACNIPKFPLHQGEYYFNIYCGTFKEIYDHVIFAGKLKVEEGNFYKSGQLPYRNQGDFLVENEWTLK